MTKQALTGAKVKAGTTAEVKTGSWKTRRPLWDKKKCINCMLCVIYCPEACIPSKKGIRTETDLFHCKGCGICANVCPVKCIKMDEEYKHR
ncbi:MAG: 4Fe-4S binding protein [Nanoarchaeota archaeon]